MDESRLEIPILIKLIAEASERDVNRQMKDQEVTATQARALGYLSYANQPIPEKKLEKALHISQPSTAGLVHRLQDRGLIATSPCPDDGRSTLVALTEKGSRKVSETREAVGRTQKLLERDFSEEEKEAIRTYLSKMLRTLQEEEARNASDK
ncbi:MAG: MarR family transcriptional regulator [Oscillospiraceae bacterium]|nr:MarR family transcriptional regulator [Oscillospiraceae bacterium]